ncbi:MAG: helix-hairpin-helix domain-containing protein, partial [Spirochaetaceae bacterium]|nr:helix-hairpin-helix domain-containing protein [Spirochaetaceae bacterium]
MELTEEFIENLSVNETALAGRAAEALALTKEQVSAVIRLLADGNTVPFIARYRKEHTGSLDETQIRAVEHRFASAKNLENRRIEITRGIFAQGKLDGTLYEHILKAATLTELEDIYAPYKKKRKTRGMAALEKGLGPLAHAMTRLENAELLLLAAGFVTENAEHPEQPVLSAEDALKGAMDIIAEQTALDPENRRIVKSLYLRDGKIEVKGLGGEEARKTSAYQMYWDYTEKLSRIRPHRILAINRGEREKALKARIGVDEEAAGELIKKKHPIRNSCHRAAVEDGIGRLLSPAVIREIRGDQEDAADDHGISVFSQNLRNLLMQQPVKGARVMGIDPGIRTGSKCACLDDTGKYLHAFVIYSRRIEEAKRLMLENIKQYEIQLIALGNGTGSREAQEIVSRLIAEHGLDVCYTMVDEDGASVYSASAAAREEFPHLDVTVRGAVSIGRRLQDPLAELVKIDPKSIGVGLYQHDVNQKKLSQALDETVSSVVNNVGVNLNTASASLLQYVSGINRALAKKIVKYREEKGKIPSRSALTGIPGMGPKTFEQCAGFLKIPESSEPLDNTWVHPEHYAVARALRDAVTAGGGNLSGEKARALKEAYSVGDTLIKDLADELKRPN